MKISMKQTPIRQVNLVKQVIGNFGVDLKRVVLWGTKVGSGIACLKAVAGRH